jgi:hypothetical protein
MPPNQRQVIFSGNFTGFKGCFRHFFSKEPVIAVIVLHE